MASTDSGIVPKIEAILSNAKKLRDDDLPSRLALMRQIGDLHQDLEPSINLVVSLSPQSIAFVPKSAVN